MDTDKDTGTGMEMETDASLDMDTKLGIITAEEAAEAAKGLTFEIVWAALMESRRMTDEMRIENRKRDEEYNKRTEEYNKRTEEIRAEYQKRDEEYNKRMEASQRRMEESQRRMEESRLELEKTMAEVSRQLGDIGNTLGEFSESMFSPALWEKFAEYGIEVTEQTERKKFKADGKRIAEADVFIENGEYAIPVEIKTKLTEAHVDNHIERLKTISAHLNAKGDKRKLLGAVAGGVVADNVRLYAQEKGLFVIVQSGDCATIADAHEGFKAREW